METFKIVKDTGIYKLEIYDSSKLYMTSDSHISHFNICNYCDRPFTSRSEMDNTLIDNWNSVVPEDGIVIHCGDFMLPHKTGFKEYWKYIKKLNGTIFLCRGNHDRIDIGEYNQYHPDVYNKSILPLKAPAKLIVNDIMKIYIEGISILACHYPMYAYPADYQIFGHVHTLKDGTIHGTDEDVVTKLRKTQYDVGVDHNNYTPISYKQLMEKFNS